MNLTEEERKYIINRYFSSITNFIRTKDAFKIRVKHIGTIKTHGNKKMNKRKKNVMRSAKCIKKSADFSITNVLF